jgi:hypothetical protein
MDGWKMRNLLKSFPFVEDHIFYYYYYWTRDLLRSLCTHFTWPFGPVNLAWIWNKISSTWDIGGWNWSRNQKFNMRKLIRHFCYGFIICVENDACLNIMLALSCSKGKSKLKTRLGLMNTNIIDRYVPRFVLSCYLHYFYWFTHFRQINLYWTHL